LFEKLSLKVYKLFPVTEVPRPFRYQKDSEEGFSLSGLAPRAQAWVKD
jgi:hypothetical protein